jgi:hyaluronan synthase
MRRARAALRLAVRVLLAGYAVAAVAAALWPTVLSAGGRDRARGADTSRLGPAARGAAPPAGGARRAGTPLGGARGMFRLVFRVLLAGYAVVAVAAALWLKGDVLRALLDEPVIAAYGIAVTVYLLSRFVLSAIYRPAPPLRPDEPRPRVAVVVPALNEENSIEATLLAALSLRWPRELLRVVVVDDGSSDGTWDRVAGVRARHPSLVAVRFPANRGKRAAMIAGLEAAGGTDVAVFVDSDTRVAPDALEHLLAPLVRDPRVAAVCGHAEVANGRRGLLARMQEVRYFAAFRVFKAAESLFGMVTCASGCLSAYRWSHLAQVLPAWSAQRFLGRPATIGDDRALTTSLLRRWRVVYQSTAMCRTQVPGTLGRFLRQQLRWKKSWTRESVRLAAFAWRRNPLASSAAYLSILFQLAGPAVALYALAWRPAVEGRDPWVYLLGLYAMALLYALWYGILRASPRWWAGIAFPVLYLAVLLWQTWWAILTCRRTAWGTRAAVPTASAEAAAAEPLEAAA